MFSGFDHHYGQVAAGNSLYSFEDNIKNLLKWTDYLTVSFLRISLIGSSRVFDSGLCRSRHILQLLHNSGSLQAPAAAARCSRRGCRFRLSPARTLNAKPTTRPTEDEKQGKYGRHCSGEKAKVRTQVALMLLSLTLLLFVLWLVGDYVLVHYRHQLVRSGIGKQSENKNKQNAL